MLTSFIEYHRNECRSAFRIPMIQFSPMVVHCRFCCLTQIDTACRKQQMLKERDDTPSCSDHNQACNESEKTHARHSYP